MSWNPGQYLQYEDARLRPALELLARIPLEAPAAIVDLGCGAGNVAQWLGRRWPQSRIIGVDGDAAMLERARSSTRGDPRFEWVEADLAAYRAPPPPVDLVFSNAALHWLDDHERLFASLMQQLAEGGVLAVQMPDNFSAPSHRTLFDLAHEPRWHARLAPLVRSAPVASAAQYHAWLEPHAAALDLWTTEYLQRLPRRDDDEHPVVAWMRGSALVPFTAALPADEQRAFVAAYALRIARAYPLLADGSALFPFRRLFVIAKR